jgi:glutathione S-transferase
MTPPVLYGLSRSVYARIARVVLEEKRVGYTFEEIEIFGPDGVPPAHFERHPFGRIPTLDHDGFVLYETGAITRYIDEAFAGVPLQPNAARARARMNQTISVLDAYAYQPMIWAVFVQRISIPKEGGASNEEIVAEALPKIGVCLKALDSLLGTQRFFAGDEVSLADLHAAPMLLYLALTVEGRKMLNEHTRLSRWLSELRNRRSVEETQSVYEGEPDP